jgi:hypothetical protein
MVALDQTAANARRQMEADDLSFLVVVSPDTDKLLGIVLRSALDLGCQSNGHVPEECPLTQHLKTDIDFCFESDPVEEVLADDLSGEFQAGLRDRKARLRWSLPVIVVDAQKVPVGLLERPER